MCPHKGTLLTRVDYEARGRDKYRTGRRRTVAYENLSSQVVVYFTIRQPNSIRNAPALKTFKNLSQKVFSVKTILLCLVFR